MACLIVFPLVHLGLLDPADRRRERFLIKETVWGNPLYFHEKYTGSFPNLPEFPGQYPARLPDISTCQIEVFPFQPLVKNGGTALFPLRQSVLSALFLDPHKLVSLDILPRLSEDPEKSKMESTSFQSPLLSFLLLYGKNPFLTREQKRLSNRNATQSSQDSFPFPRGCIKFQAMVQ